MNTDFEKTTEDGGAAPRPRPNPCESVWIRVFCPPAAPRAGRAFGCGRRPRWDVRAGVIDEDAAAEGRSERPCENERRKHQNPKQGAHHDRSPFLPTAGRAFDL